MRTATPRRPRRCRPGRGQRRHGSPYAACHEGRHGCVQLLLDARLRPWPFTNARSCCLTLRPPSISRIKIAPLLCRPPAIAAVSTSSSSSSKQAHARTSDLRAARTRACWRSTLQGHTAIVKFLRTHSCAPAPAAPADGVMREGAAAKPASSKNRLRRHESGRHESGRHESGRHESGARRDRPKRSGQARKSA